MFDSIMWDIRSLRRNVCNLKHRVAANDRAILSLACCTLLSGLLQYKININYCRQITKLEYELEELKRGGE